MEDIEIQAPITNGTSKTANSERPVPSLTPEHVELINSTWEPVKVDLDGAGEIMFTKLFEIAPQLKEAFSFREDNLEKDNSALIKHGKVVMESIDLAIGMLDDIETLQETLIDMGVVHNMKEIKIDSFGPVAAALIYTLETGLGDKFTPEAKDAWITLYTIIQHYMTIGMTEGTDI